MSDVWVIGKLFKFLVRDLMVWHMLTP